MPCPLRAPTRVALPQSGFCDRRSKLSEHGCRRHGDLQIGIVKALNANLFEQGIIMNLGDPLKQSMVAGRELFTASGNRLFDSWSRSRRIDPQNIGENRILNVTGPLADLRIKLFRHLGKDCRRRVTSDQRRQMG